MNIILLEPQEAVTKYVTLSGDRAHHIVKVLRSVSGDTIRVGVVNGMMGSAVVRHLSHRKPFEAELELCLNEEPPLRPAIDVLLALPRPIMFKRIISQLTALGIGHLYVVNANRVEKSFWDASLMADTSLRSHLLSGLEQAVDTRLPGVSFHKGFRPFVEQMLPTIRADYKQMLLAHPLCTGRLTDIFKAGPGRVLLAIGPEGGWVDFEIDRLTEAGFTGFSLGSRILKVETAVTAVHSMVSLLQYG